MSKRINIENANELIQSMHNDNVKKFKKILKEYFEPNLILIDPKSDPSLKFLKFNPYLIDLVVYFNAFKCTMYLLGNHSDIQHVDDHGVLFILFQSLLHYAARGSDIQLFTFLCTLGYDMFFEDNKNRTPLYYAIKHNNLPVCKYIWANGGNTNHFNYNGIRPLHLAAKKGNLSMLDFIIRTGIDPNQYDDNVY